MSFRSFVHGRFRGFFRLSSHLCRRLSRKFFPLSESESFSFGSFSFRSFSFGSLAFKPFIGSRSFKDFFSDCLPGFSFSLNLNLINPLLFRKSFFTIFDSSFAPPCRSSFIFSRSRASSSLSFCFLLPLIFSRREGLFFSFNFWRSRSNSLRCLSSFTAAKWDEPPSVFSAAMYL